MDVLIVEENPNLGGLWTRALERGGAQVSCVQSQSCAIEILRERRFDVIVVDLVLHDGGAIGVSDFVNYRWPETQVIFVTNTRFFSDGSIFQLCSNACAFVQSATPPDDLAAMVEHYAERRI